MECKVHAVGSEVSSKLQSQWCRNIDVRVSLTDEERAVVSRGRYHEQFARSVHEHWVVQRLRQHLTERDGSVFGARLGVTHVVLDVVEDGLAEWGQIRVDVDVRPRSTQSVKNVRNVDRRTLEWKSQESGATER